MLGYRNRRRADRGLILCFLGFPVPAFSDIGSTSTGARGALAGRHVSGKNKRMAAQTQNANMVRHQKLLLHPESLSKVAANDGSTPYTVNALPIQHFHILFTLERDRAKAHKCTTQMLRRARAVREFSQCACTHGHDLNLGMSF